jgi:uncharacterized protein (TIGR03437 family)
MFRAATLAACGLVILSGAAKGQNLCYFFLLDHFDSTNNAGLQLSLQSSNSGPDACQTDSVNLVLMVGNGSSLNYAVASPAWQFGHTYTAQAVIASGSEQILLDGQMVASGSGALQPAQAGLLASELPNWGNGQATYAVTQTGLQIANGPLAVSLPATGPYNAPPIQNTLLGGPPIWSTLFTEDPTQTITITATFELTAPVSNPLQYDPYIDPYGQSNFGAWPTKVMSGNDLETAIATEQSWFVDNPLFAGLDVYGGSTVAGWQDAATGYYHTAFHHNRWWLISPLGNPEFYISVTTVTPGGQATPITGREGEFEQLPPTTGATSAAYSQGYWGDDQDTTYVFFDVSNLIAKYGTNYMTTWNSLIEQRLASWGFQGSGKWSPISTTMPSTPVLYRTAVANVVPGGHPDTFDPGVVAQLQASLAAQIGSNVTNPFVVGWSVGNELAEEIQPSEVQAILDLGPGVPAKQALVNQALTALYGGNVTALTAAWGIPALNTVAEVYGSAPTVPQQDIEPLREFYEQNYDQTMYQTVKAIDPNHLYLGNWVNPPSYWVNSSDWAIVAANTDVIGFDYYSFQFATPAMNALMESTNKPVMVGEYAFPPDYDGQRGFGSSWVATETEAASGALYAQWLQATSACSYCVGVSWFEYEDEPVSGRGMTSGSNIGTALEYGEDYAWGLVDVTDQPKYDLLNPIRAANLAALQTLGLLPATPGLTAAGIVNAASYVGGAVSPGEIVALFVTNAGPASLTGGQVDSSGKLATETGATRVLFNGYPSPMVYSVAGQVAAVVPYELAGQASALVQVEYQGIQSPAVSIPVAEATPAVFTAGSTGQGQAAMLNQDFSLNSAGNPAAAGSVCVLYATGAGQTNPPGIDGQFASNPYAVPELPVTVTVGGIPAIVRYAGAAPTEVAGVLQINFQVPARVAAGGAVPVVVTVGTVAAPSVTMAVL